MASELDPNWRERAVCRLPDVDPAPFFPTFGMGPITKRVRQAKRICGACPVRAECLDYGLRIRDEDGIYGGLTADERSDMLPRTSAAWTG